MSICLNEKLYSHSSILLKDADSFGFDCTKGFHLIQDYASHQRQLIC